MGVARARPEIEPAELKKVESKSEGANKVKAKVVKRCMMVEV